MQLAYANSVALTRSSKLAMVEVDFPVFSFGSGYKTNWAIS
jgi:uncharacterized protein (DUF934 family)